MCLQLISNRSEAFFSPVQVNKSRGQAQADGSGIRYVRTSARSGSIASPLIAGMHLNLSFSLQRNTATKV